MYEVVRFCPDHQHEATRLSVLFQHLLTEHSLGTVVAATFNNVDASDIQDNTTMNMWHKYLYKELDSRFNFSLGQSVIALSTVDQLKELAKLDPPYLDKYEEIVKCTDQLQTCEKQDLSGKLF